MKAVIASKISLAGQVVKIQMFVETTDPEEIKKILAVDKDKIRIEIRDAEIYTSKNLWPVDYKIYF